MAVSDGKMKITDSDSNSIEIALPEFGYKSIIEMPFDLIKSDSGKWGSFDYGETYDKRICQCECILTATEQKDLDKMFLTEEYNGRYEEVQIELNTSSGFYPFAPDKGDGGVFDVLIKVDREGIQSSPFRHFKTNLEMINVGDYPAYSAPESVTEGNLQIGDVTGLRFPENFFKPNIETSNKFIVPEDTSEYSFLDKGYSGDSFETSFGMICNNSRAYELIYEITQSKRSSAFNIICENYNYPFGYTKGNSTIAVKLIQNNLEITHENFNKFTFDLNLSTGDYIV